MIWSRITEFPKEKTCFSGILRTKQAHKWIAWTSAPLTKVYLLKTQTDATKMRPETSKRSWGKKARIVSYQWPDEKETDRVKLSLSAWAEAKREYWKQAIQKSPTHSKLETSVTTKWEKLDMGEFSKKLFMFLISSPNKNSGTKSRNVSWNQTFMFLSFKKTCRTFCGNKNRKARANADEFSFATCQN